MRRAGTCGGLRCRCERPAGGLFLLHFHHTTLRRSVYCWRDEEEEKVEEEEDNRIGWDSALR
eukprot:1016052-Pyramimonas_sp.AAC.1